MSSNTDLNIAQYVVGQYRQIRISGPAANISYVENNYLKQFTPIQIGYLLPSPDSLPNLTKFVQQNQDSGAVDAATSPMCAVNTSTSSVMSTYRPDSNMSLSPSVTNRQLDAQQYVRNVDSALKKIASIPALLMYVNPSKFTRTYTPTTDVTPGRRSHIVSMWLEQITELSMAGSTAACFSYVPGVNKAVGLSNESRTTSLSYANLMSLVSLYIDNANFVADLSKNSTINGIPFRNGSLYILYDNNMYIGSFDTMKISESANKPFLLNYDFTFHARQVYTF